MVLRGMTANNRKEFIPVLTSIRIFGAVAIVLFHFQETLYCAFPQLKNFSPVIAYGHWAVSFFFMLSGFLMAHHYCNYQLLHKKGYLMFIWKRLSRLLPIHILTHVLVIPIRCWAIYIHNNWGAPIPSWFSAQNWVKNVFFLMYYKMPFVSVDYSWNTPAWSVHVEFLAYCCQY